MNERTIGETATVRERISAQPRPALVWVAVLLGLILLEFGAVLALIMTIVETAVMWLPGENPSLLTAVEGWKIAAADVPTLLSRDVIPNQGWQTAANGPWEGTFLGLEPKFAWLIRFLLVYAYAGLFVGWFVYGYRLYVRHYRIADWTPRDDVIRRFRNHSWGKFGAVIVLIFVVMALFAPALGPTTVEQNIKQPYSYEVKYLDEETGEVTSTYVGDANTQARSQGGGDFNVGLWEYDDFGRFHPFGTMSRGQDLFTFMMYGARVSLFIGLLALGISGIVATVLAMLTAYYKGLVDLGTVIVGDSLQAIPLLLVLIMASAVFDGHWIESIYNGGFLIALLFGIFGWPALWRAVRGPAFQVSTEEWVDAARSYGQSARLTMQKHMLPYVVGYLLVYASMTLGGIIITTAALSFLGIGVDAPTPEWGRAVDMGQPYIATQSWHIGLIPGIMIVLVVTAFNALGDGIRDSIDPKSEGGGGTEVQTGGGGGA